jgi:hypothetical protein
LEHREAPRVTMVSMQTVFRSLLYLQDSPRAVMILVISIDSGCVFVLEPDRLFYDWVTFKHSVSLRLNISIIATYEPWIV